VTLSQKVGTLILLGLLASCSDKEVILEGAREDLRSLNPETLVEGDVVEDPDAQAAEAAEDMPVNQAIAITLPATVNHADWTHPGGSSAHHVQHPALSATPQMIWSVGIGAGNSRKYRITAEPILADGRIYTMDSQSGVAAHSTTGAPLWRADLTPASDAGDASGGGLAYANGTLFATSGFGTVTAMDPATGAALWTQKLDAPISGAPAVRDGIVHVGARDNRAWAIDAETGRVKWQLSTTPEITSIVGTGSPALSDRLALYPFPSGEVLAALRKSGVRVWSSLVSGERRGRAYTSISDLAGEPVIVDGVIYAGTTAGRLAAMSSSGARLWTAKEGAASAVTVAGGSVFLVSDQGELVRLDSATGDRIWGVPLPYFANEKIRRRKAIFASYGPVLAGGRLWVASTDGVMRGFNPEDGAELAQVAIPGGAATRPIIVNGVAYIVSAKGQLLALR